MNCEYLEHHLDPYLDGELRDAALAEKVRRHLDVCAPCRREFNLQRELKLAVAQSEREESSPYLESRIMHTVTARKKEKTRVGVMRYALASALTIIFGAVIWVGVPTVSKHFANNNVPYKMLGDGVLEGPLASSSISADEFMRFAVANHSRASIEVDGMLYAPSAADDATVVLADAKKEPGK